MLRELRKERLGFSLGTLAHRLDLHLVRPVQIERMEMISELASVKGQVQRLRDVVTLLADQKSTEQEEELQFKQLLLEILSKPFLEKILRKHERRVQRLPTQGQIIVKNIGLEIIETISEVVLGNLPAPDRIQVIYQEKDSREFGFSEVTPSVLRLLKSDILSLTYTKKRMPRFSARKLFEERELRLQRALSLDHSRSELPLDLEPVHAYVQTDFEPRESQLGKVKMVVKKITTGLVGRKQFLASIVLQEPLSVSPSPPPASPAATQTVLEPSPLPPFFRPHPRLSSAALFQISIESGPLPRTSHSPFDFESG